MLTYKGLLNKYDEPEKKIGPESPTRKRAIYPAEVAGRKAAEKSAVSPSGAAQGQSSVKNNSLTALSYGKALPTVETVQRNRAQRAALPTAGTVNPSFGGISLWQKQPAAPTVPVRINLDRGYQVQNTTVNPTWGLRQNDLTKSTAADEKTRLYETNDSLLSGQELLKKYNYVLQDTQMDRKTKEAAARKAYSTLGRAALDMPDKVAGAYEVARLQAQLQSYLKTGAFTAGLLNSMGGDGASILSNAGKKLGLPLIQEQNQVFREQVSRARENNPTAAMLGAGAGELSKAGAGYMTVGKWAEGGLKKGADALGKRMAASTASDASQRLAAWATLNPAIAKLLEGGTRLLAQQAADTAVNTPITLMAALAEGKSRGEIGRDIGRQMATDAAFNVGLEGMGMAARALTRLKGSMQTKVAMKRIPEQIEKGMTGQMASSDYIKLGKTPPILQKYGMADGEMLMPQSVVPKAAYPAGYRQALARGAGISENQIKKIQGHNLGFEPIRQLPERLKDPVAILKSDTRDGSIVVLTDMIDKYGQPVIVPVRVDQNGFSEFSSVIPSMYGKKGFAEFMEQQKGNILYWNEKKNLQHFPGNGVQFPEPYSDADPMLRIAQRAENVKGKKGAGKAIFSDPGSGAQMGKKIEGYQVSDAKMPPTDGRTALELPSDAIVTDAAENVNTAQPKKLLPQEEIPKELLEEYQSLSDHEAMDARLREISNTYGDSPEKMGAEVKKLFDRLQDLEDMLGIRTEKVKSTEKHIQTDTVKELKKLLSLSGKESTQEATRLIKSALAEGRMGKISGQTRERIFNELFDYGRIHNRADVDQELKRYLQGLKLKISEQDAANIPDFAQWRKGAFGKIGSIGIGQRGNVDTAWLELNERWPQAFPQEIVNPADQLQRIRAVADEMSYREIPLAESVDQGTKAAMRAEFDTILDALETQMQKLTSYTDDRAALQQRKLMQEGVAMRVDYDELTAEDVKKLYDQRYQYKKAAEKVRSKKNLTEGDKALLEKLHRGELDAETARKYAGLNGDDLLEVYQAEKPLRATDKMLQEYKKQANGRFDKQFAEIMGDIPIKSANGKGWRDLLPLRMMRETQERILDMIAPTKEAAERLRKTIFDPIHTAERDRMLFIKGYVDRLAKLELSTKKNIPLKLPSGRQGRASESALVQWLGEKRYQLRQMERKKGRATAEDIAKEQELRRQIESIESNLSREQLQKIDKGIAEFTAIYKEIHPKINEALIRNGYEPIGYIEGYFPHMSFDDPNNIMEAAAKKLGFDFSAKELPMDIAGRTETFRPGKKWAGNLLTRTGKETDYDAIRAFDQYIDNISDVIYHTDNIKRLRAYEDYMRYTLSDEGIRKNVEKIRQDAKLSAAEKETLIDAEYEKRKHSLQNYVNNIRTYTDLLAGKKHKIDRWAETEVFGRPIYRAVNEIENRVAGNMVAGNIGSALTNFIPITQGMSSMSLSSNLRGLKEAMQQMARGEMDELTKKSAFLTTRGGTEHLYKTAMQKFSEAGGKLNPLQWMETADQFSTQAVWRSRYYDNLKKGMAEDAAIQNADAFARGLFAGRSKGAMPNIFASKTFKPATMFQLEVNNQISYLLKDIPKEAQGNALKLMKAYSGIAIGAYIYNDVYEKLTGRRSALDPLGTAREAFGDATGRTLRNTLDILGDAAKGEGLQLTEEREKQAPSAVIESTMEDIGGNVPFVGGLVFGGGRLPLQSADPHPLQAIGHLADARAGEERAEKSHAEILRDSVIPAATYLNPFVGGGQVRKTVQGLNLMRKGGSYAQTDKGEKLQFAVDQSNPATWAQAALFGKWATPEGQAYMNGSRALNEKSTQTYEKLLSAGVKNLVAAKSIMQVTEQEKPSGKRRAIRDCLLDTEQKGLLYYDLVASEKDREILDGVQKSHGRIGAAAECLMQLAECSNVSMERTKIRGASLPNGTKEYIYLNKVVSKDSREKEQKQIDRLKQAAIGIDDYLTIKNRIDLIKKGGGTTTAKTAEMCEWMNEQGYTWEQQEAVLDAFRKSGKK